MAMMYGVGPMLITITQPVTPIEPPGPTHVEGCTFSDPFEACKELLLRHLTMDQLHRLRLHLIPRIMRQRLGTPTVGEAHSHQVTAQPDDEPDAEEIEFARQWLREAEIEAKGLDMKVPA